MLILGKMPTIEEAKFVEESDLVTKLLIAVDMGSRGLFTAELGGKLLGVYGSETYSDGKVTVYRLSEALPGRSHWVVKTADGEEVFHAYQINQDRKPEQPVFRWEPSQYELLTFKRGPWLDYIKEVCDKSVAPEKEVDDLEFLRV